jgi:hypothetical protein
MTTIGRKYDSGKPEFSLLPPWALESVAKVLTFGAEKYDIDNWKHVSNGEYRYRNAALRHINDYVKGEKTDPESGCNHLAHAICCLMFILDADESGQALAPAEKKFDVPKVNYAFMTPPTKEEDDSSTVTYTFCGSPTQEIMSYDTITSNADTYKANYEFQNRSSIPLAGVATPYKYTTIPVRTGLGGKPKQ